MALVNGVKGSRHTAQTITWQDADGTGWNLTGATITARLKPKNKGANTTRTSDGAFALVTAASGIFTWTYGAIDVRDNCKYKVQFRATYGDATFDLTEETDWEVEDQI